MKFTLDVLLNTILANEIRNGERDFHDEIISALHINCFIPYDAEQFYDANKNKIWDKLQKFIDICIRKHIIPYYELSINRLDTISYHSSNFTKLSTRSYLFDYIIKCTDREYEVVCGLYYFYLGAKKY